MGEYHVPDDPLHRYKRDFDSFDREFEESRNRIQVISIVLPIVFGLIVLAVILTICICLYRRRMQMNSGGRFFTPTYTTRTFQPSYPQSTGYPSTVAYPQTSGYPSAGAYPSAPDFPGNSHINQTPGFIPPPSYGECVSNMNGAFPSSGLDMNSSHSHDMGGGGIGFDNMGSSSHTGGGNDFGSSCHDSGSHGVGSSSCGGNDF